LPETLGDLPAAVLAEEIETPGQGQIRALLTYAGNPVLSVPNGRRLDAALGKLEFMASIDLYINETTRHADVILPPRWTLAEDHVDLLPTLYSARNVVRWSPPVIEPSDSAPADWQILLELIERLGGGPTGMRPLDRLFRLGRRLGLRWRPTTTADLLLRLGRYGDHFLPWSRGLNLKKLAQAPHGIDLGPLEPGVTRRVLHKNRKIQLAAPPLLAALDELAQVLDQETPDNEVLLIGRRDLRSNNSWMHNVPRLVSGRERCVLFVHPADAKRAGIGDGEEAMLESRVHRGAVRVRVNNEMREGVVSLPHGWGHAPSASWQRTAGAHAGVSVNDWTDDQMVESVVGRSILNGVPIRLHPAPAVEQPAAASIA
ncbi:MAG: molybdopterin dinucleotide binding domain-containing protein, partial [Candidatus Binatia bacterium]